MKRHTKLVPLSREHHRQLLVARLIRSDAPSYKGLPETLEEKLNYTLQFFNSEILTHFDKEHQLFDMIMKSNVSAQLAKLIKEQRNFQEKIISRFDGLTIEGLDETGRLLELSIRHEERQLFQLMQEEIELDDLSITFS